jgi:hypothetical protein
MWLELNKSCGKNSFQKRDILFGKTSESWFFGHSILKKKQSGKCKQAVEPLSLYYNLKQGVVSFYGHESICLFILAFLVCV